MASIMHPFTDDLFLKRIFKVILEGSFNEVISQLNELQFVPIATPSTLPQWRPIAKYIFVLQ